MTRGDIIHMAQTAGLLRIGDGWSEPDRWGAQEIVHFAALIEKEVKREAGFDRANLWLGRINEAIKHEREACAEVCDELWPKHDYSPAEWVAFEVATDDCADAIRARGAP